MFTYRYRELAVALEKKGEVRLALAKTLRVKPEEIFNLEVERFSLDSRRKGDLHWSYNVVFDLKRKVRATGNNARGLIESKREIRSLDAEPLKDTVAMASHVDVIGAGPSGLWAALHLLRKGFSVDIYEQGKQVEERFRDIRKFFVDRKFNAYSNVLFGEGGAGAFSDGKLNTRSRNLFSETVLKDMVDFGVDESVVTFAKPHIGTDKLVLMLRQIRAEILRYFASDYLKARRQGFRVGAYHFFSTKCSGAAQAQYFINSTLFRTGDLPPVLDIEPSDSQISSMGGSMTMWSHIRTWLNAVERRCGVKPILYVNQRFVNKYLPDAPDIKRNYKIWIARYGEYKPDVKLVVWQLSPDGRVNGITGEVDINVFNGYQSQFESYLEDETIKR